MFLPKRRFEIRNGAFDLIAKASSFAEQITPVVTRVIGALMRSMNCHYSNLVEGQNTHPRDIDLALHQDYSTEPKCRVLQLGPVAYTEVQEATDEGRGTTLLCQI
jgi:hypothetical protein